MPDEVIIRPSSSEDAAQLHAAIDGVARERRFLALLEAPRVEDVASFCSRPGVASMVAVRDGIIVGWADIQRMQRPGFTHRGVLGMGVISAYRRQGIGQRLLTSMIDHAASFGVSRLELEVFSSNLAAVSMYQRSGFVLEGQLLRARILDGIVDDILLMARRHDDCVTC
jgi:ribosomal protein S18 acetylase RimI-like enzyme